MTRLVRTAEIPGGSVDDMLLPDGRHAFVLTVLSELRAIYIPPAQAKTLAEFILASEESE